MLFGAILRIIYVSIRIGIVHVLIIIITVTVPITVPISAIGVMMHFAISVLSPGCTMCPQAEPSKQQQTRIEDYCMKVPPVSKAPDQRNGIHRPIET